MFFAKKRNAPIYQQLMTDLSGRLQVNEPLFSQVGIDYFGPLLVKQGQSQVKRCGCVFKCLSICAVYLEVAHSLKTVFLQVFEDLSRRVSHN